MQVSSRASRVAESLGTLLLGLPDAERPRFLAILERRAADRYDAWAEAVASPKDAAGLRACAAREREIAARVEQHVAAPADEVRYQPLIAEVSSVYLGAFEGATQHEGYALQAWLERSGAAAWRGFASSAESALRDVFLACATLEEESATFLERLCA